MKGLEAEIPDLQERVDHILTKQVFGIGITRLTAMLARRSVYCSKNAAGEHSIAKSFTSDDGNIWFERTEHTWVKGKCKFCGASEKTLARGVDLETHAYVFIHTDDIKARLAASFPITRCARRSSARGSSGCKASGCAARWPICTPF